MKKVVDDARSRWRGLVARALRRWRRTIAVACRGSHGRKPRRAAWRHGDAAQRRHRRRRPIVSPTREGRYLFDFVDPGQLQCHRRAAGLPDDRAEERARAAARRRHGRSVDGTGDGRREPSRCRRSSPLGAVQLEQLRPDARAPARRPSANQRPQSLQPGEPRSVDRQHAGHDGSGEPAVPPRLCERLRRRRRHPPRQRRAARRRPARRQLQDRPTRRRWTRSRKSPFRRTASTPKTATASAASSA